MAARFVGSMASLATDGALRLAAPGAGRWLSLVAAGRAASPGEPAGGAVVYRDVEPGADSVVVLAPDRIEELRVLRGPSSSNGSGRPSACPAAAEAEAAAEGVARPMAVAASKAPS